MTETIYAKLITYRDEFGGYTIYVFQNLETGEYEMVTRLPRWETPLLEKGDIGFLKYTEVIAGKDTWFNNQEQKMEYYRFTNVYFVNFVADKPEKAEIIL